MSGTSPIKALFLDIGGVLLTNGWGSKSRITAAEKFSLDFDEMNERHHIIFDTYESGKMTLDEYLNLLIFYEERPFTMDAFKEFMLSESKPFSKMIDLISNLKRKYNFKTIAVNNEGRELNEYRIKQFDLEALIDFFVSSCYIHLRKPDSTIYKTALDTAHVLPHETIYIDDRYVFIQTARTLGLNCVHHTDVDSTSQALVSFGLTTE